MVLNDPTEGYESRPVLRNGPKGFTELFAKTLENIGYPISNTAFDTSNILIFDVRGLYAFFIQLLNTSVSATVDYKIDFSTIETDTPETIPSSALFELVPQKQIAAEAWSNATLDATINISEFIRATPKITFIRISLLTSAGPTTVKGVLSAV